MIETNDKFEKRLSDSLAHHQVDAPADMWDRIAASMAQIDAAAAPTTAPITIAPHRRQRLGVRRAWQYGIAAMLLLGIGLLANRLARLAPQPDQSQLLAEASVLYDPATTETPAEEPAAEQCVGVIPRAVRNLIAAVVSQPDIVHSAEQPALLTEEVETLESANNNVPTESNENVENVENVESNENVKSVDTNKPASKHNNTEPSAQEQFQKRLQEVMTEERKRRGGRITTSLYASNTSRLNTQQASPLRLAEAGMVKTEVLNSSHGEVINNTLSSSLSFRHQPETELNHRVPFTVGVGVQYELTNRWALESGVTYTYLNSTGKSEGMFAYKTSQELHYVGVPLSASYKFVDTKHVELYARAGGAVERAVAAKRTQTISTTDENIGNSTTQKIDCKGVQLSATVAVGAELKITQRVGLYAEAGAGYFFDNNQPLSYRTEHPLSLTLQAGARLHFGKN